MTKKRLAELISVNFGFKMDKIEIISYDFKDGIRCDFGVCGYLYRFDGGSFKPINWWELIL